MIRVAAVIPTYNRWGKTERFLTQFAAQTYGALSIVIVDADSPDGTASKVQLHYPDVTLLQVSDQQYWAGATNAGVRYVLTQGYDYIFTINDDATVAPSHIQQLVDLAQRHGICILGNRIDYLTPPDKIWALGTQIEWGTPHFLKLQYAGVSFKKLPTKILEQEILAVDTLPGDGVLIHCSVFEKIGLYKDTFLPHYHADSELILRAKRYGIEAYVAPHVVLQDDFSAVQKQQDFKRIAGLKYAFFHPKSHLFAPAIAYIFLRYCPWYAYPSTLYHLLIRLLRLGKGRSWTERSER